MLGQYRAMAELEPGPRTAHTPDRTGWRGRRFAAASRKSGGQLISAAAVSPLGPDGGVAHRGDPEAQARATLELLAEALAGVGASLDDVSQVCSFHLDPVALAAARRACTGAFGADGPPVWTAVGMTGTREEGQLHAIHALAVR
jgi:enamine deaminase RidA (YjgF/YER057c/UK114 family)